MRWSQFTLGAAGAVILSGGFFAAPPAFAQEAGASTASAESAVESVLDAFHQAASDADGATYFGLFHPDGVFLGTDATERWTVDEFRAYAEPYFAAGRGWTYVPVERHVSISPDGDVAWFDERLMNDGLGETRGSGVLVQVGGQWKVAQYNLTIPIPNSLAGEFVQRIRQATAPDDANQPD